MNFQNMVCWDANQALTVLETNAEQFEREIFLAVHNDSEIYLTTSNEEPHPDKARSFLRDFLSPAVDYRQVFILGDSGTGKSHLIKWMELNIPFDSNKTVLTIPKTRVSLRGVIERIVNILPDATAKGYRDILNQNQTGAAPVSQEQMRTVFLSDLALMVEIDDRREWEHENEEVNLLKMAADFLNDPFIAPHLKREGGVVDDLCKFVVGSNDTVAASENWRGFVEEDLLLGDVDLSNTNLSIKAYQAANHYKSHQNAVPKTLELINRNIEPAIKRGLNLNAQQLIQLMTDVRIYLKKEGKELILLIEDLSVMQGIDRTLIDALQETETKELCSLRWAAACTTGYYNQYITRGSIRTRNDFVIHMDRTAQTETNVSLPNFMKRFASKYLNAARADSGDLKSWADGISVEDKINSPPNRCENCSVRSECHSAFGEVDGIGLYPLNERSISQMYERVKNPDNLSVMFNPRTLIVNVLREVIENGMDDIEEGTFPSTRMLANFGHTTTPPLVRQRLESNNNQYSERQLGLLEFWLPEFSSIQNPEQYDSIFSVFGVPKIDPGLLEGVVPVEPKDGTSKEPDAPVTDAPVTDAPDAIVLALRSWGNGENLQARPTSALRQLVYDTLAENINWDLLGLRKSEFMGSGPVLFSSRSGLTFDGQLTRRSHRRPDRVSLEIPISPTPEDRIAAAVALEGLYLFSKHGTWEFNEGRLLYLTFAEQLDKWTNHVIRQFRNYPVQEDKWNAVHSAAELLVVGSAMGGLPQNGLEETINSMFEEWPSETNGETREWNDEYRKLRQFSDDLQMFVRDRCGSNKGARGPIIDLSKILDPIIRMKRNWKLSYETPELLGGRRDIFVSLTNHHKRISDNLHLLVDMEYQKQISWLSEWDEAIPADKNKNELISAAESLYITTSRDGQLQIGNAVKTRFKNAIETTKVVEFDKSLKVLRRISGQKDTNKTISTLGLLNSGVDITTAKEFLIAFQDYVAEVETSIENRLAGAGNGGTEQFYKVKSEIESKLITMNQNLDLIIEENELV